MGQRRGLDLGGAAEPNFVVRLEPETARVVVGPRAALARDVVRLREVNWLDSNALGTEGRPGGRAVQVKLRSTQEPAPGRIAATEGGAELRLDRPQFGVSPGQAAVIYDGTRVLGGGWIAEAELAGEG